MKNKLEFIYATKLIGEKMVKKRFTNIQWNFLGKDKNGWKLLPVEASNLKTVKMPEASKTISTQKTAETKEELLAKLAELEKSETHENIGQNEPTPQAGDKSTDDNKGVVEAIAHMKTLKTEQEIIDYTEGDKRSTVINARDKFISELK